MLYRNILFSFEKKIDLMPKVVIDRPDLFAATYGLIFVLIPHSRTGGRRKTRCCRGPVNLFA